MSKKNRDKRRAKKEKTKGDKKPNRKRRKDNRTLSQKSVKGGEKVDKKARKKNESKIKVLAHELLAFTFSYLMLAPW
jgi:hypothetical protein